MGMHWGFRYCIYSCKYVSDRPTNRCKESEMLERSELESDILPPTPQPWMPHLN